MLRDFYFDTHGTELSNTSSKTVSCYRNDDDNVDDSDRINNNSRNKTNSGWITNNNNNASKLTNTTILSKIKTIFDLDI